MDWKLFAQLLVMFIVSALGWWIVHTLSARRDVANERRKLLVSYLLEVYRNLEKAVRRSDSKAYAQLESAIADIQLLGSPSQVKMASEIATSLVANSEASINELLFDLRDSLRSELHLESVKDKIIFFRIGKKT